MGMTARDAGGHEEAARRELFAVLAHELRSPIGAILGFEELLSEGILGDMPPAGADALARIRGSARQLLDLVAGLSDLALQPGDQTAQPESLDATDLIQGILQQLDPEAAGRQVELELSTPGTLPPLFIDSERTRRALHLAFMAAIKSSAGARLQVSARLLDDTLVIDVIGTRLDALRDDPDVSLHHHEGAHLTGPGLRLAMARRALELLGGDLALLPAAPLTTLRLSLTPAR